MKIKSICLLLVTLVNCSTSAFREARTLRDDNQSRDNTGASVKQGHTDINEAARLVRQLQSDDELERKQAKIMLGSLARQSADSRGQVVLEAKRVIEDSDARRRLSSAAHYDAWTSAAELLGELKATEALDALIECIDCTNGIGGLSTYRYPALRAIIMIGQGATPKLKEALNNERPTTRKYAVLALAEIGGAEARKALEDAASTEQDGETAQIIKMVLREQ
jgi:HEAT repeat protein